MFGQNNKPNEDQLIPDQAIEGALAADASATPVAAGGWGHPGTPIDDSSTSNTAPVDSPATPAPVAVETPATAPAHSPVSTELTEIKQHALAELAPLVDHLEQSPEEKFRTTMMMIQASDDQSLVATAYEAALGITDEKIKAQALLDVINEINYFSQQATPQA